MEELKLIRDNYWATKDGRIYSTKRNRYLKQRVGPRGYMMVNLSIDGIRVFLGVLNFSSGNSNIATGDWYVNIGLLL